VHNMTHWYLLIIVWLVTLFLIFVRGGKGVSSIFGVPTCGVLYWIVSVFSIFSLPGFSLVVLRRLIDESEHKRNCGYPFAEGDVVWTKSKGSRLALVTLIAGVIAGLIGIGGGMVVGPMLLELEFIPQVSSALTATNVLMSSSAVSVMVLMGGAVPFDEALFFGSVCFLGAYFGKSVLGKIVNSFGKTSLIILILGGVIFLAIVAVIAQGLMDFTSNGIDFVFSGVCD